MKYDIVKREIKIFIIGLQKTNPEIMPDPPVAYLENYKCDQIYQVFTTPFTCVRSFKLLERANNS